MYGLAFGDQASKRVEDLSRTTGGKGWLFNSAHLTQSLDSMLDEIFQYCGPIKDRPFINKNAAFKLLVGDNKTGMFHVETGSANRPTTIYITYEYPDRMTNDGRVPLVAVKSPGGRQYSESSPEYTANPNLKAVIFKINNPDPGTWTYNLKNQENNNIHLNLMITSENGNTNDDPIRVKSWISDVSLTYPFIPKIYAEVNKNLNPVLNATVIANVFKPNGDTIKVSLQDNGKGADAIAYDGIYSEFYTYFNGNGRYAIDITVDSNNGGAGISSNLPSSQNSGAPDWPYFFPDDDDAQGIPMSAFPMSDFEQVDEEFETSALYDPAAVAQRQSKLVIKKVEDFERFSTAGTFILSQWQPKDMIQPGWISDLKVTVVDKRNRTVSLEWTSAGDDMFTGNASFVDVRYHFDLRQLLNSFDSAMSNFTILSGSLQPSQPYQVQILRLQLPSEDHLPLANTTEMIYFAIRTVDEERNIGDVSSTAFANFRIAKAPPFKRSCNKYIQLVECSKSLPIQDLKSAFHEGKNILETYDLIAKYDNDCISTVEMKNSGNIPNHCWSAIDVALEDLRNKLLHPLVHQEEQVMNLAVQFGEEQIIKSLRSY